MVTTRSMSPQRRRPPMLTFATKMHSTQAGLNGRKGDAISTLVRAVLIERSRAATSEGRNHRAVSRGSPPNREPLEGSLCQQ